MNSFVFAIVCLALIFSGFAVGILFSTTAFQPSVSSGLLEYLLMSEPQYHNGTDGWLAMTVNNTGIGSITLVKVSVNYIKQSLVNPALPVAVAPDQSLQLNVTMNISEGETYRIDLFTSQGNRFSAISVFPYQAQLPGVMLYKANVNFYNVNGLDRIDVDIGNSGTSDTTITALYVGLSTLNLVNQTITPQSLVHGGVARITIDYNWTSGTTYYFKVFSQDGQTINWPEQAPTG
jgi:hypothetical protein